MVLSQPAGARPLVLRPKLVVWRPPEEFRWRATFIHGRLFTGEHGFRLEKLGDDRVRFVHDENFSGLLVPLYSFLRLPATRRGFSAMNEALRDRAEALVALDETRSASASDHAEFEEPTRFRRRVRRRRDKPATDSTTGSTVDDRAAGGARG